MQVSAASRNARLPTAKRARMSVIPPLTPPSSRRLNGMPGEAFFVAAEHVGFEVGGHGCDPDARGQPQAARRADCPD